MISGIGALSGQIGGNAAEGISGAAGAAGVSTGFAGSFAELVSEAAGNVVSTLHNAEQMSVKGITGEAGTREVVDAVMSAEQSLQAAIAIRDKIVSAYLEVSRMQI
jgi:flagellar hook-basal body complex protein FliE